MSPDQITAFAILIGVLFFFVWGKFRYDLVAFAALVAGVITGIIPSAEAFAGFSHPAVITVALVLMLSEGLQRSGAIDVIADFGVPETSKPIILIPALAALAAALSGLINNVGALALLMPVAIQSASRVGLSPAMVLMPLSFGSILGGMTTLIGTPPNIIVANYRAESAGEPFGMFSYSWIGIPVAVMGVLFVAVLGWRLIPKERLSKRAGEELFEVQPYVTEVRVTEDSAIIDRFLMELGDDLAESDVDIIGLIRGEDHFPYPPMTEKIKAGDIFVIRADADALDRVVADFAFELVGAAEIPSGSVKSDRVALLEAVVMPRSRIENLTPTELGLRTRFKLNLLAVSRHGKWIAERLGLHRFKAGEVLLLQGEVSQIYDNLARIGCLPLAKRSLRVGMRRQALVAVALFVGAILAATLKLVPITVAFGIAVAGMILVRIMSPSRAYSSIDISVIVLLAAMIPVGGALESTGAAKIIADSIVAATDSFSPVVALVVVMIVTMTLSDIINNAATAVVMAPIAALIATQFDVNSDPFLMAVAIGASCAFLTPVGHQNNTLILGPGGYKFSDYWRMGLPLEILVVVVSVPLLLFVWPL